MKRLLLVCLLALLATPLAVSQAQSGPCSQIDSLPDSVVRIGVGDGTVPAGGVFCTVIHNGNDFVMSPGSIGDLGTLQRGVLASVDTFALGADGLPAAATFAQEVQVCLRGTGEYIFLNAANTPRVPSALPAITRTIDGADYTCALIGSSGVNVLVNGEPAPRAEAFAPAAGAPAPAPTTDGEVVPATDGETGTVTEPVAPVITAVQPNGVPLTNCRVSTTAIVRIREVPVDGRVLGRVPFDARLTATEAVDGWTRVIYLNFQGWISNDFLIRSGDCG